LVSNQDFLKFVQAWGYRKARYWTKEGRQWLACTKSQHPKFWRTTLSGKYLQRNLFSEMPLPMDWPVEVNYLEAKAYCNWMAERIGEPVRLPVEAEWYALRQSELGEASGEGNINLEQYASSCPVTENRHGRLYDVTGNVWQWTESAIDGYPGFTVHPWYDDFSTPTFDGKHNLIKGGSWISTGNETLASSRYAFRRHFFQHAGFRMVISEQEPKKQAQDNVYETDELIAQYCEFHYGNEYFSVQNFPVACVQTLMTHVQANSIATDRALDLGCAVGRSSFELAKNFQHVDALDFSARFVQQGAKLQAHNRLRYTLPVEGDIVEYREILLDKLGYDDVKERIDFLQGDACNLKPQFADYNVVFAGNLIDRLYEPAMFLNDIQGRILSGGLLVLTSPYTWLEEYTDKSNWLGGVKVNGENFSTLDALKQQLADSFDFEEAVDVPFVIRETARKHQHTVAQMTIWRKR
jgi:putative 4-mercaptohistidine N1-methyltranferase